MQKDLSSAANKVASGAGWRRRLGLSTKLLLLTIAFVMLAEILIFVPSIAKFRIDWFNARLESAYLASLAAEAAPEGRVPQPVLEELLRTAQVMAVARKRRDARQLVLLQDMPQPVDATYDLREAGTIDIVLDALATIARGKDRVIRVIGGPAMVAPDRTPPRDVQWIEIVMGEKPLREAMRAFGGRILVLSIVISLFTATLIYLVLNALTVRPIERIVHNMMRFRKNPEDAARIIVPSQRTDEIGLAERELSQMQSDLSQMLHQKNRLAALGLAVSKINHDLRNMLASAQLISDRFQDSNDPTVQRFAPKLIGSLNRAIQLCADTLAYGRAEERAPRRTRLPLGPLVEDVAEGLGLPGAATIALHVDMPADLEIDADPDHLHRVLNNLVRNAIDVLDGQAGERAIWLSARREEHIVVLDIRDNGPGIPARAREHMFEAFRSSDRKGGTGLGLAIASELVRAHGGTIELVDAEQGAHFRIRVPDRA